MNRPTSIQVSPATDRQIVALRAAGFGGLTDIVRLAIDRMYAQEIPEDLRYEVQHTGRPLGPSDVAEWHILTTVDTLTEAQDLERAERRAMHERCGPGAWDDMFRIVPTANTTIVYHYRCQGPVTGERRCRDGATASIVHPWPAGEPRPEAQTPAGWSSPHLCAACAEIETAAIEQYINESA
jgi:hypothetical protein